MPCIAAMLAVVPMAMAAEMRARQEPVAVAAPTQPVVAKSLEAPAYDSDTRHIQAIVNRDDDISNEKSAVNSATSAATKSATLTATPVASVVAVATPTASEHVPEQLPEKIPEKIEAPTSGLTTEIRVFAIRWHEVFDMLFSAALVAVAILLYRHSRIQTKMLMASVRAAEDAARAAQAALRIAQDNATRVRYDDRGQASFDL